MACRSYVLLLLNMIYGPLLPLPFRFLSKAGFLNLSIVDIMRFITFCGGRCLMHCRMFSSIVSVMTAKEFFFSQTWPHVPGGQNRGIAEQFLEIFGPCFFTSCCHLYTLKMHAVILCSSFSPSTLLGECICQISISYTVVTSASQISVP